MLGCVILGGLLLAPASVLAASPGNPVALLTEIRPGQGEVRVKLATDAVWKPPLPLLSLRAGDQVRVTRNATAVLMFNGGQGTLAVLAANSPYTVQGAAAGANTGKVSELVTSVMRMTRPSFSRPGRRECAEHRGTSRRMAPKPERDGAHELAGMRAGGLRSRVGLPPRAERGAGARPVLDRRRR